MSTNRLFIYDPQTHSAVCIAKGYTVGWATTERNVNQFFDNSREFTGNITSTRYQLRTEADIPKGVKYYWPIQEEISECNAQTSWWRRLFKRKK